MEKKAIFLSYAREDAALAQPVAALLEAHGYSVWWDHDLHAGEDFRATIARRILTSQAVVALFSGHSVTSAWVLDEAGRGHELNKLIPVLVGEARMPLGFGTLHHCGVPVTPLEPDGAASRALLAAVHAVTGSEPTDFSVATYNAALALAPPQPVPRRSRFAVSWLPSRFAVGQIVTLATVFAVALAAAILADPDKRLVEWVRLLHIYTGMIVFGGGIFLFLIFRISDREPTTSERVAVGDLTRVLLGSWRFAAVAQIVTGAVLLWTLQSTKPMLPWLPEAVAVHGLALYFWWRGFHNGISAIEIEAMYREQALARDYRRSRDRQLTMAVALTAVVLVMMVYRPSDSLVQLASRLIQEVLVFGRMTAVAG